MNTPTSTTNRLRGRQAAVAAIATGLALVAPIPASAALERTPGDGPVRPFVVHEVMVDRTEVLDLSCDAVDAERPAVECAWRRPGHPDAAAVRLVRTSAIAPARTVVYRSSDLDVTTAVDDDVRAGVRHAYRLVAVSSTGRVVGVSRASVAGVADAPADPQVEVVRLDCGLVSSARVACEWSTPTVEVRRLTLWRSVDGRERELVASFSAPGATSYVDGVPRGASRIVYAVVAEDGAGSVVARSRPEGVVVPDESVTTTTAERPVEQPVVPDQPVTTTPVEAPAEPEGPVTTAPAPVLDRGAGRAPGVSEPVTAGPDTTESVTAPAPPARTETRSER